MINEILNKNELSRADIIKLLSASEENEHKLLLQKAYDVKCKTVGKKVYLRGLIELSNKCIKNCFYCGIRASNSNVERYTATEYEIMEMVDFAWKNKYSSIVIQSGELSTKSFTDYIEQLLKEIKKRTSNELRVTLSCGEQSEEIYRKWFDAGARRYLLRIETSSPELYTKLHPNDEHHSFETRIKCLQTLRKTGYQVGSGVMIGLPFQTIENLADDIIFFRNNSIDMVGMGPYIEHEQTPLFNERSALIPPMERYKLALRMISVLRIVMPNINIASATALQAIEPKGRIEGLYAGANIIMPNLTPGSYKKHYLLYDNKPCIDDTAYKCNACISGQVSNFGEQVAYGEYGDSLHFISREK